MKATWYYRNIVEPKRPYIQDAWCMQVVAKPDRREIQPDGRIRYWGYVEELGRYLRVVTLPDAETVLNAFPDRNFKPWHAMRFSYDAETDSLYIHLSERPGTDAAEAAPGIVIDFDKEGRPVGIDIEHARALVDLDELDLTALPVQNLLLRHPV